jgi:hypothetical protein
VKTRNLLIFIASLLLAGIFFVYERMHQTSQSIRNQVLVENMNKINRLQTWIARAAEINRSQFESAISNRLVYDATALPGSIIGDFPQGIISEETRDSFGHPLHVKFTRSNTRLNDGTALYYVSIWSDGPNHINEGGKEDDIALLDKELKIRD